MDTAQTIREYFRAALDLVLPRVCPGCESPDGGWCSNCASLLDRRPRPVRLSGEALDASGGYLPPIRAVTRYQGPVRAAILAGKESGRRDLPAHLGAGLGRALLRLHLIAPLAPPARMVWLVPAPSRAAAARRRGGDPMTVMARAAASTLATAGVAAGVAPCLVTAGRARDSVGLTAAQRVSNLQGRIKIRTRSLPEGTSSVVLLDDVLTSGATAVAAIRALEGAGLTVRSALALATAAPWLSVR